MKVAITFVLSVISLVIFGSTKVTGDPDSLYRHGRLSEAIEAYEALLDHEMSHKRPDADALSELLYSLGSACEDAGRLDDALRWYGLYQNISWVIHPGNVTDSYNLIGNVWFRKGDFSKAISFYFRALYDCMDKNDTLAAPSILNNIGNVYFSVDDYGKAQEYYQRSIMLMRILNMRDDLAASLINSGNVFLLAEDFSQAEASFREAYVVAIETRNRLRQSSALTSLGILFERTDRIDSAEAYFSRSLALMDVSQTTVEYMMTLRGLGAVELKRERFRSAYNYLNNAFLIADSAGFSDIALDVLNLLLVAGDSLHQPEVTIRHYRRYAELRDASSEASVSEKLARYELSYRNMLREKTIGAQQREIVATQRSKRFITWFFIALFVFAAVLLLVLWRLQQNRNRIERHKTESRLVEIRLQALSAQINPHFVSNALNSIQSCFINGDVEKASDYLADFGMLIRMVLDNSVKNYVSLNDEMHFLKLYLNLEQLRLNHRFTFDIVIDEELRDSDIFLPPLLVQPYVENAVWHGLSHKSNAGHLSVRFSASGNYVTVTISDNGIGMEESRKLQTQFPKKHRSYAMEITRERIRLLGEWFRRDVDVKVTSPASEGQGTEVLITVPVIHQPER